MGLNRISEIGRRSFVLSSPTQGRTDTGFAGARRRERRRHLSNEICPYFRSSPADFRTPHGPRSPAGFRALPQQSPSWRAPAAPARPGSGAPDAAKRPAGARAPRRRAASLPRSCAAAAPPNHPGPSANEGGPLQTAPRRRPARQQGIGLRTRPPEARVAPAHALACFDDRSPHPPTQHKHVPQTKPPPPPSSARGAVCAAMVPGGDRPTGGVSDASGPLLGQMRSFPKLRRRHPAPTLRASAPAPRLCHTGPYERSTTHRCRSYGAGLEHRSAN